jgi:GH35 family endo-1,4-beta-xylanase
VAFHTARAAAPKARLVYNDYMGWEAGNEAHRAGVLKLLEGFRKRGVPVDALGVQSHLGTEDPAAPGSLGRPQEKQWRAFLDEATGMGYDLLITEFDVNDRDLPGDIASPRRGGRVGRQGLSRPDARLPPDQGSPGLGHGRQIFVAAELHAAQGRPAQARDAL